MLHTKFDNHEWSRIILRRIHEGIISLGDIPIMIENNMIHMLTCLSNEGINPMNERNVRKLVEMNVKIKSDGRNTRIDNKNKCQFY